EFADALGQLDADRRPAPWCEGGEEVGEVTWRRVLGGDAGGAIQRPAWVGQLAAHPLRLGGAGELLDQPQGAEHARGHPGGSGDLAVLDIALAAHPVHLRAAALQALEPRPVGGGPVAVEQARGSQQPRPGTDAEQVRAPAGPAAAPRPQPRAGGAPGRPGGPSHSRSGRSLLPAGETTAGITTTSGSGAVPASTSPSE